MISKGSFRYFPSIFYSALVLFFCAFLVSADWIPIPPTSSPPPSREDHVLLHRPSTNELILVTGTNHKQYFDDLYVFDETNLFWHPLVVRGVRPPARSGGVAVMNPVNGNILIWGGITNEGFQDDMFEYTFERSEWVSVPQGSHPRPPARQKVTAAVWEDSFLIFGGRSGAGKTNDVWQFNLTTHEWSCLFSVTEPSVSVPVGRLGASAHVKSTPTPQLFIYGGYCSDYDEKKIPYTLDEQAGVWMLDLLTRQWTHLKIVATAGAPASAVPKWRSEMAFSSIGDVLFFFFGVQKGLADTPMPDSWKLDLSPAFPTVTTVAATQLLPTPLPGQFVPHTRCYTSGIYSNLPGMKGIRTDGVFVFSGGNVIMGTDVGDAFFYDATNDGYVEIHPEVLVPRPRAYHRTTLVDGGMWMFGGVSDGIYLNDLHVFDLDKEIWLPQINPRTQGFNVPRGRIRHSLTPWGDFLLVYGGLAERDEVLDDFWMYSIEDNTWVEASGRTTLQPPPLYGHCAAFGDEGLVIYGGQTTSGALSNDLWIFNKDLTRWESRPSGPEPRQDCTLLLMKNKLYVIGGVNVQHKSIDNIDTFDTSTHEWEHHELTFPDSLSYRAARATTGLRFITYSGLDVDNPKYRLIALDLLTMRTCTLDDRSKKVNPSAIVGGSAVYYKSRMYIFGGDQILGRSEILTQQNNQLYTFQFDMTGKCLTTGRASAVDPNALNCDQANLRCGWNCSSGTYQLMGSDGLPNCTACATGSFTNATGAPECTKCFAGYFNPHTGSASSYNCFLCKPGTYTDMAGQAQCKACDPDQYCPAGSTHPGTKSTANEDEFQPGPYLPKAQDVFYAMAASWGGGGIFALCALILVVSIRPIRRKLHIFDLFSEKHQQIWPDGKYDAPKRVKKTSLGGVMATMFGVLCLSLVAQYGSQFLIDNIAEVKAIIPMVVLNKEVQDNLTTHSLYVGLRAREYGGYCRCTEGMQDIVINVTGITPRPNGKTPPTPFSQQCTRLDRNGLPMTPVPSDFLGDDSNDLATFDCLVEFFCTYCKIEPTASVDITYKESKSYCFGYSLNVTVDTAIPMQDHQKIIQKSSILKPVIPTSGDILRGIEPTEFKMKLVPSIFEDTDGSNATGFHVFEDEEPKFGSQVSFSQFAYVKGLSARVLFEYVGYALRTAHTPKRGIIEVGSLILGALSGLLGIFGVGVSTLETFLSLMKEQSKKRRAAKRAKLGLPPESAEEEDDPLLHSEGFSRPTDPLIPPRILTGNAGRAGIWGVGPPPAGYQPNAYLPGAQGRGAYHPQ